MGRVSPKACLLLMQLICLADEEYQVRGEHQYLAHLLNLDGDDAESKLRAWLEELEAVGEIRQYRQGGGSVIAIVGPERRRATLEGGSA